MSPRDKRRQLLIACDLDGTLLDSSRQVSVFTRAILVRLHKAGWPFVIATARPVRDVRVLAEALEYQGIAICGNGSLCFDFARNEVIDYQRVDAAGAAEVLARLRAACPDAWFGAERHLELVLEEGFWLNPVMSQEAVRVSTLDTALDHRGFGKIILQLPGDAQDYLGRVRAFLPLGFEITVSSSDFCEIMLRGVTKAATLQRIAARYGFTAQEVVAFGDMPNDLPMLTWAGTGVAVANAHPEVLAAADDFTESNDQDGVAHYLERLLDSI
jgi:HAD superfamily hydrolase (TIGR01484 family)